MDDNLSNNPDNDIKEGAEAADENAGGAVVNDAKTSAGAEVAGAAVNATSDAGETSAASVTNDTTANADASDVSTSEKSVSGGGSSMLDESAFPNQQASQGEIQDASQSETQGEIQNEIQEIPPDLVQEYAAYEATIYGDADYDAVPYDETSYAPNGDTPHAQYTDTPHAQHGETSRSNTNNAAHASSVHEGSHDVSHASRDSRDSHYPRDAHDSRDPREHDDKKHSTRNQKPTMRKDKKKKRHIFTGLNYISQVIIGFVFISAFTVLIAIGVISIVWNQYFQMYTSENMNLLAETTSNRIASAFEETGSFNDQVLSAAVQAASSSNEVGVRVLKNNGEIVFDSTDALPHDVSENFEPNNATQVAISNITVGESVVGSVRVWVYGSDVLMNHLDEQFRDNTYRALLLASAVAIVIASLIGFVFARKLVSPINKVAKTALALSEGDYSARTGMDGNGEVSKLGATLDEMARSIERDRDLERRLTSDVAHELRTPLMAIQSTVEAMIDGVYQTDDEHLMLIDSEVRRLSRLVDALLKLSRLENRTQPFKEEVINLGELIEGIVISHEVFVVDSGLAIEYHAEPHVKIMGDPDKIRQAVANLISNAVRYTPEGGSILVEVHQEGKVAAIDVSDTGVGLTPEEEQMVFSRFWRADAGRKRESGGLGIGLAVVKEIVDRHKGKVLVKGEKGVGSTFTILLPIYDEKESLEQARRALRSFEKKN